MPVMAGQEGLVLVTGFDGDVLHVRNPSGHTQQARNATLPLAVFVGFYAKRAISSALATS